MMDSCLKEQKMDLPGTPAEWESLRKEVEAKGKRTEDTKHTSACSEALGLVDSIHVLKDGIFKILGWAQRGEETVWFGIPTCLSKDESVLKCARFEDFWKNITPEERTHIMRLGTICILNKDGQVLETYASDELELHSEDYRRDERLVHLDIIRVLLQKVRHLEEKMEKVYNAPNMPGAIEAEKSFREEFQKCTID
jgi:hypothetical protein